MIYLLRKYRKSFGSLNISIVAIVKNFLTKWCSLFQICSKNDLSMHNVLQQISRYFCTKICSTIFEIWLMNIYILRSVSRIHYSSTSTNTGVVGRDLVFYSKKNISFTGWSMVVEISTIDILGRSLLNRIFLWFNFCASFRNQDQFVSLYF